MGADPEVPAQPPSSTRKPQPSEQELSRLIEEHNRWLGSEGREGVRAFAGPLDLCGMDLRGANLERADFTDVDLRCANLAGARLLSARGLAAERLGGANLTDAEIPEAVSGFETLRIVEELSKTSRALLVTILAACAYCWLTIGTTMDGRLLANTGTSPLPIIQTNVPIASFYWIVPVALLAASIYLHLHLQKFWQGLASLPAVFPNAMRLDERVYPWLLSSIASRRIGQMRKAAPRFAWLETALAELITWWIVPLTIAAFWLRYLSRHDVAGTTLHVAVFVVAVTVSLVFREAAYAELSRRDGAERPRTTRPLAIGVATLFIAAGFSALALETQYFGVYGLTFFPDLRGARLSGESLRGVDLSQAQATGAILDGADLREARLNGVPFERSNLRASKLEEALIDEAHLDKADLRDASLQGASLRKAILRGARLNKKTDLSDTRLEGSDLRNVDLKGTSLTGAHFDGTTRFDPKGLRGSDASGAFFHAMIFDRLDLRDADFTDASLEEAVFQDIRADSQTRFNKALLRRSKFICTPTAAPPPERVAEQEPEQEPEKNQLKDSMFDGARLQGAEFGTCRLKGVSFEAAQMQRVTFRGTRLKEVSFDGARLQGAEFSTCRLKDVSFESAQMQRVTFRRTNLKGKLKGEGTPKEKLKEKVSFDNAVLDGAQFLDGTDVSQATFKNARLNGADLRGALHLTQAQLNDACGDAATKLPAGQMLTLKTCSTER